MLHLIFLFSSVIICSLLGYSYYRTSLSMRQYKAWSVTSLVVCFAFYFYAFISMIYLGGGVLQIAYDFINLKYN